MPPPPSEKLNSLKEGNLHVLSVVENFASCKDVITNSGTLSQIQVCYHKFRLLSQIQVCYHKFRYAITNLGTLSKIQICYHKFRYAITNSGTLSKIQVCYHKFRYCHNAVCIVTRLRAGRPGLQVPARARDFSLLQKVQTCCGAHPASYSTGKRPVVPRIKRLRRETYHSPPPSSEV